MVHVCGGRGLNPTPPALFDSKPLCVVWGLSPHDASHHAIHHAPYEPWIFDHPDNGILSKPSQNTSASLHAGVEPLVFRAQRIYWGDLSSPVCLPHPSHSPSTMSAPCIISRKRCFQRALHLREGEVVGFSTYLRGNRLPSVRSHKTHRQ